MEIGNTVIVVEHDEDIMREAEYIVDIGPKAGVHGGQVVFAGTFDGICKSNTETGAYLSGKKHVSIPKNKQKATHFLQITGAKENNLKNIDVQIPLEQLSIITGVSGSGKSSLIMDTLAPYALNKLNKSSHTFGAVQSIQ